MYYNYRKIIEGFFLNQYITPETDATIGTFESFMKFFMDFVNRNSAFYPMTKTAFIPSSFCSPMVSGLSISLSDLDPSDDEGKEEFKGWSSRTNTCVGSTSRRCITEVLSSLFHALLSKAMC